MSIKVGGTIVINDARKGTFETVNPGTYATADRPPTPEIGDVIYDTDEDALLVWNGTEWIKTGSLDDIVVTKGIISPSVGVEQGDTLTGTATYENAVEPITLYHKWYLDGVQDTSATTNTFKAKEGEVTYRLCVADPNNTTPIEGALSDPVTVGPATKPNATMYGLRFDGNRQTYLGSSSTDISSKFTFSCWHKHLGASGTNTILCVADKDIAIEAQSTGAYSVDIRGINFTSSAGVATKNAWQHVVVSYDGSEVTLYVNGDEIGSTSGTQVIRDGLITMGSYQGTSNWFSGYLSEVYFAEGQVLDPETFGKNFEAGWGPLDSSVILDNIATKTSPYDTRPNMDEKWSDSLSLSAGTFQSPATNAFDGVLNGSSTVGSDLNTNIIFTTSSFSSGPYNIEITADNSHTVTVDDAATTKVGDSGNATFSITVNSFTNITVAASGSKPDLAGIKVNGRVLIDGPADNSQNWSDFCALTNGGTGPSGPFTTMFDGDLTQGINASNGVDTFTFDIGEANKLTGSVRFYLTAGTAVTGNWLKVNGQLQTLLGGSLPGWITVDGVNELWSFSASNIGPGNIYGAIAAVEVDGKLLIDAGAQWDTSQVWSTGVEGLSTFNVGEEPSQAFDGSTATQMSTSGAAATDYIQITFSPALVNVNNFEVYTTAEVSVAINATSGNQSSLPAGATNTTANDWSNIGHNSITPITSLRIMGPSGGGNFVPRLSAIRVDDEILVDGGSFGANGFYLPFDPEAERAIYTGPYTGTPYEGGWSKIFNGEKGVNASQTVATYTSSGDTTMTLTTPFSGQVTVYASSNAGTGDPSGAEVQLTHAGGTKSVPCAQQASGNPAANHGIDAGALTNVSAITIKQATTGTKLYWIEVDGELLVDHNSIGVDASGNNNNFHDENFAVGNTSQVWSSGSLTGGLNSSFSNLKALFDGNNSTRVQNLPTNTMTIKLPVEISGDVSFWIRDGASPGGDTFSYSLDSGSSFTPVNIVTYGGSGDWVNLGNITINTTDGIQWKNTASNNAVDLRMMTLDSVILIDSNQQDTVTDTPMMNYSVLEIGPTQGGTVGTYNGNLETQGSNTNVYSSAVSNLKMSSGKYYAEFTTLQIPNYNAPYFGVAGPNFTVSGGFESWDSIGSTLASVGVSSSGVLIGLAFDADSKSLDIYVDGVKTDSSNISDYLGNGPYEFYYASYGTGQSSPDVAFNFGQQPFIHPVAGYESLYQTWTQWVTATLRTASAEADALKSMLRSHAQTYTAGEDYCEGSVIKAFDQLWIAVNDAPATTFADLPAITSHPNWERLGITV